MSRKLGALMGLALSTCLVVAATPTAAPAASPTVISPAGATATSTIPARPAAAPAMVPAGQLDALRRDLGRTAEELAARLAVDATAAAIEPRMRAELAEAYAGTWVTADGRATVVGLTDPTRADQVRAAGAEPRIVTRSLAELRGLTTKLDRRAAVAGAAVHAWYIALPSNTVSIEASNTAAATTFARAAGLPDDAVSVVVGNDAYRPLYDIRGGDQYVINSRLICSIGFAVAGGFVTAGHCGNVGEPTTGSGVAQGVIRGSSFPGDDLGWVETNANWTPRPWVSTYDGNVVTVTGSQEAAVGAAVCRSGRTTGWKCGTITAKNVTVNYSAGPVYGMVRSTACAQPGDSGGPFVAGSQAQGVTSGGSGNCTTGGSTVYQPVNEILSRYGLSLTTSGGGSTHRIIGLADKCVDVPGANGADGQYLNLWHCNGTNAQDWTLPGDGTIRAFGLCMDVAWGSVENEAVVQLAYCSGNPAQQWVFTSAGELVNPQANKCLDVKYGDSSDGARLQTFQCHGGANQQWRLG
ncbi:ricin-type beta-trefoil lectin domain protein [Salinispora fenicalii]|uniref:ricin-type beta-trefoil lectin domain protein n=1 Tax=Salinispora fenicalii TaxID=1137263 RepID=UPI0004875340|nr:ricin-type beta-trefoil lectin domain protein [Salinispora fenicalii]